ncbi:MAG: C25 family cysteine peptidase [Muribaculum sp.]|nr:C25 family cysteine peptidase [Muribaculum sp.]
MYQLTKSRLADMGFESPEKVSVFGFGGVRFDDDNAVALMERDCPRQTSMWHGDKLIFYGEGPVAVEPADEYDNAVKIRRSPYSLYGYYFLTESDPGSDAPLQIESGSLCSPINKHRHIEIIDGEKQCYDNLGTRWFDTPFQDSPINTYKFDAVESLMDVNANITVSWFTDTPGNLIFELGGGVISYSEALSAETVKKPSLRVGKIECDLSCGQHPELTLTFSNSKTKGFTAVDYVALDYLADNVLAGRPQMEMYMSGLNEGDYLEMQDVSEVWDVTSPSRVIRLEVSGGKVLPDVACRKLIAFDPDRELMAPEVDGIVKTQNLFSDVDDCDMLIVTHYDFLDAAEELADIHERGQHLNVRVVTDEQIYNEFSSGQPSPLAIRAYVKWIFESGRGKMKYLLLYGDGSYDNRGILEKGIFLPTYQCPVERYMFDNEKSFCSDAYFGMTDDRINIDRVAFGEVSVSVGRITVRSEDEAFAVNQKVRRYIEGCSELSACMNVGMFISDSGDSGVHLKNADALASLFSQREGAVAHKVYSDLTKWINGKGVGSKKEIAAYLRNGVGYVHYVGHGTEYNISGQDLWGVSDVSNNDYAISPIVFHSSCLNGRFDGDRRSLAEEMLVCPNGGAVSCIMASRNTDATYNQRLHKEFIDLVNHSDPGTSLGDVWKMSQNICVETARSVNNSTFATNVRHFNLIGDPALPLRLPEYKVLAISAGDITGGSGVAVKGEIRRASGEKHSGFNGRIEARVYRTDVSKPTLGQDGSNSRIEVDVEDVLIGYSVADVVDGAFDVLMKLPSVAGGCRYRILFFVNNGDMTAVGSMDGLTLSATDGWIDDATPPEIRSLSISGSSMSGMVVSPKLLYAEIVDKESGIFVDKCNPENSFRLTMDGTGMDIADMHVEALSDRGILRLAYTLPDISDGKHEFTLSVSDNAGNRAVKSLTFTSITRIAEICLDVESRSVRDEAVFSWTHDLGDDAEVALLIRDMSGQTVFRKEFFGTESYFGWDLRGFDGDFVRDGMYRCFLLATDRRRYASSHPVGIVVLK